MEFLLFYLSFLLFLSFLSLSFSLIYSLSLIFYHSLSLIFYHSLSLIFYHSFSFILYLSFSFSFVLKKLQKKQRIWGGISNHYYLKTYHNCTKSNMFYTPIIFKTPVSIRNIFVYNVCVRVFIV